MPFHFDIDRAIQLVALCIRQSGSDRMNTMKLLKLLYIADRESLRIAGYVLTGDAPFALPHGPVPTRIYDLTKTSNDWAFLDQNPEEELWCSHFKADGRDLCIAEEPGEDRLSEHDKNVISDVMRRYGRLVQFELRDLTHEFAEWRNNHPGSSSRPIPLRDILEALGCQEAIDTVEQAQREDQHFAKVFGS